MSTSGERQPDAHVPETGIHSGKPENGPPPPAVRRGPSWLYLGVMGVLLVILAFLGLYPLILQRGFSDSRLMAELRDKTFSDPKAPTTGDWPQWRGPNRDGLSGETGLATTWPAGGPPVLWQKPIKSGYSSVVVVGDRLYTMMQDGS